MVHVYYKSAVQLVDCAADCAADYKLNLYIPVCHTIKNRFLVLMVIPTGDLSKIGSAWS